MMKGLAGDCNNPDGSCLNDSDKPCIVSGKICEYFMLWITEA